MKKLTDPSFRYVPSYDTDIRKRFKRIQAEQKAKAEREARNKAEADRKVEQLAVRKAGR